MRNKVFRELLLSWHERDNDRTLPWKEEKDPYKIWLSEIILQQTRAEQGLPYYLRFIRHYPNVQLLATAADQEVFKLWEGLGYYSRCRNLLHTARTIVNEFQGIFPGNYKDLLKLKGIGPYTAAAISSFAFNEAQPVIDGNVYRVLARYHSDETPYDSSEGKKHFGKLAKEAFDADRPAAYNQAIMDFGATICTPKNPKCDSCPLESNCLAKAKDTVLLLPIKSKRLAVKTRHFHYWLLREDNRLFIRQRTEKDIWQSLHELYLVESENYFYDEQIKKQLGNEAIRPIYTTKQRLTHQLIISNFYQLTITKQAASTFTKGHWITKEEIKNYAFPKTIVSFLREINYF